MIISNAATEDLLSIVDYIAHDNASAALNFYEETINSLRKLRNMPRMGSAPKNRRLKADGYKRLILDNYIAWYKIDESNQYVNVIRVLHGAMKQEKYL